METGKYKPLVIDLPRQIGSLLPVMLRKIRMRALLETLFHPLTGISQDFYKQSDGLFYRANANGSVISLRHHIRNALGIDCEITEETSGRPVDFRVMILSGSEIDLNRLNDFISRYKVAGKSFILQYSPLTAEFIEHVCERADYSIEFTEYVCERADYSIRFTLYVCERIGALHIVANATRGSAGTVVVWIRTRTEEEVKSNLTVRVGVYFNSQASSLYRSYELLFRADTVSCQETFNTLDEEPVRTVIEAITPQMDGSYGYLCDESNRPDPTPAPTEAPTPGPDPSPPPE
jgi:hypothetical protein